MNNLDAKYKKKFLTIFFSILGIFLIGLIIAFLGYKFFIQKPAYDPSKQRDSTLVLEEDIQQEEDQGGMFTAPVRTNVLITGVDKAEALTDVMMVASFISTTGEINLISIPRDTYIKYEGEALKELRKINSSAPSHMKANSVYAYGKKDGMALLEKTIEDMLGIKIDYYVKVDLDAFKSIVDAVGGIYFDVPAGGLRYSDPTQDLYINLKEGRQLLNGEDAEGLVRFRKGYARQDLQRVEVQQQFLKEFITQVLNKETILNNLGGLSLSLIKYVDTDFGITDLPKYISLIPNIKVDEINTATLPGTPETIDGLSYYLLDTEGCKEIIDEFFYGNTDPSLDTTPETSETETTS